LIEECEASWKESGRAGKNAANWLHCQQTLI
jgi:hypothetical protein